MAVHPRWLDAALGRHHSRGVAIEETQDLCACDDCGWTDTLEETHPIRDFWSRVEPSGIMPAGECPRCGVLADLLPRPNHVAVMVEGGLVQNVVADRPDELQVAVVDYDTEGCDGGRGPGGVGVSVADAAPDPSGVISALIA